MRRPSQAMLAICSAIVGTLPVWTTVAFATCQNVICAEGCGGYTQYIQDTGTGAMLVYSSTVTADLSCTNYPQSGNATDSKPTTKKTYTNSTNCYTSCSGTSGPGSGTPGTLSSTENINMPSDCKAGS
jgi:hypothetical protein